MIATQNFFQKDRFVILADVYRSMVSTAANQIPPVFVLNRALNFDAVFASGASVPYINALTLVMMSDSSIAPDALVNL